MKRLLWFVFTIMFFFACKQNVESGGQQQQKDSPTPKDTSLKQLVVEQVDGKTTTFDSPVGKDLTINLSKKVSEQTSFTLKATPKEDGVNVYFDGSIESNKTKTYNTFQEKIKIELKAENSTTTVYNLTIKEITTPPPQPKPQPTHNMICNVVDSVGGTNIEGVSVKAYLAGSQTEKGSATTDASGNAKFKLEANKAYDFIFSKKGRAASRLENAYIKENEVRILPIIMREWFIGSKKIAPEMNRVQLIEKVNGKFKLKQITDDFELDLATLSNTAGFFVSTNSKSGEIIPEKVPRWNNNNGIGMNIGSPFRHASNGFAMTRGIRMDVENGKKIVYRDGYVEQAFTFEISSILALDGEVTLYFIAYDQVGNRCERQERIRIKNGGLKNEVDNTHYFEEFQVTSKRYYRSLATFGLPDAELFGMPSEKGIPTSLNVEFIFKFNEKINVGRVDILRRDYQTGNIQDGWECVYIKQYSYNRGSAGTNQGYFFINDDSGTLEEGKIYQYKLVVYGEYGKITSNVATIRVMESFNVLLTNPAPRATINKSDIGNQDFSFNISTPSLWDRERSDYFSFGILVLREQYSEYEESGQAKYHGLCFASKLKYDFTKAGDDALLVAGAAIDYDEYDYKVFNTLSGASSLSLSDVFKYENGTIILKNRFFAIPSFNTFGKYSLGQTVLSGIHYWDVPNMAKYLLKEQYDRGVAFVKTYPYLDATTGEEVVGVGKSQSSSYSNLNRSGGAINGRSVFTVKD